MQQARGEFQVVNQLGLHARAAAKLVQLAASYQCDILVARDDQMANAKSIMGILLLCGARGTKLRVEADGPQANEAVAALGELIASGFGEGTEE